MIIDCIGDRAKKLPTKIFHYSKDKIKSLKKDFNASINDEYSVKPCGLWVSIEDDDEDISWFEWCKNEEFRLENLKYKYTVNISSKANILHLKTPEEIDEFTNNYVLEDFFNTTLLNSLYINWKKVKEEYDGIIISPYQWGCRFRLNTTWYYPWDCSSGCIWNTDKISIKLHSTIDVESIRPKECLEVETSTDSLLASLVLSP